MEMMFRSDTVGLREREAKVYLASLELGPSTAQQIAIKTGMQRGSAYAAIGILKKRKLMHDIAKGKKQHFIAERPSSLLRLIKDERKKLERREKDLKASLPSLESLARGHGTMDVMPFAGPEGLKTVRTMMLASGAKRVTATGTRLIDERMKKLLEKKGRSVDRIASHRQAPAGASELAVFGDMVVIASFDDGPSGCLIKDKGVAELLRGLSG